MEVINPRSALLSNFEVLTILRELDLDHIARTNTAIRIKKEDPDNAGKSIHHTHTEEVSENLRTVELEAIQYLSADYQPTRNQTDAGISQLVRDLASFSLTKAEKLQVVNLAPSEPVELYVIVEELEDRLGDHMDEILNVVSRSLSTGATIATMENVPLGHSHTGIVEVYEEVEQEEWEHDPEDIVFDDSGEGIGVEGDLDMEED